MCVYCSSVAEKKRQKEIEAGITDVGLSQDSATAEERQQLHRDSASTLNRGSSTGAGSGTQSYELQTTEGGEEVPSAAPLSVTLVEASNTEEGNSQQVCVCLRVYLSAHVCVCSIFITSTLCSRIACGL